MLLLVMLSLSELIFTSFYIYLSQKLDVVPLTGAVIYLAAVVCLYHCYKQDNYQYLKEKMIKNLLNGETHG